MPNRCMGTAIISGLSEDKKQRLKRWAENHTLCEQIMPYPKNVKDDLRMEDKCNAEEKRLRRENGGILPEKWIKELKAKYPYKQLRYSRRCNNWGSKWGLCHCRANIGQNDLELQFDTAWSPVRPIFQEISRKYKCKAYYERSEPGCWFSGRAERLNGELVYEDSFDDPFFGNAVECKVCGQHYDSRCEDDRGDMEKHICADCYAKNF